MRKRFLSIMLSICMVLTLVPQVEFTAAGTSSTPSVSAYATKAQLMDGTFAPDSTSGTAANIGKLVFGKKQNSDKSYSPEEWYILGKDTGVAGDNTIIFAASPIVPQQTFGGGWNDLKKNNQEKNSKTISGDCSYTLAVPSTVYLNHYGASDLHAKLKSIATESPYFNKTEQGMMNETTVTTKDIMNNAYYTTTDKLYALAADGFGDSYRTIKAGSNNQAVLSMDSYCNSGDAQFWLRSPGDKIGDSVFHDSCFALYTLPGSVGYIHVPAAPAVRPAGNLNLSNVLFASAATAATTSNPEVSGTIASGTAMTLRLDGSSKNIGSVLYNTTTGDIKATKGWIDRTVSLVVQGKDGANDWYYSKKITGTQTVNADTIKEALKLSYIDLSTCKIWLEAYSNPTERGDGMIYAVNADKEIEKINTTYATKEQLMNAFSPYGDGSAANIGKLVFGKNSKGAAQEWYILGKDDGVTGDNTVIFAASQIAEDQKFSSSTSNKTYNGADVYANHYGASDLRAALNDIAASTSYFTTAEKGMMNDTTVTTKDIRNSTTYTTQDKLYALAAEKDDYQHIKAGSNDNKVLNSAKYWASGWDFWLRSPDPDVDKNSYALVANTGSNTESGLVSDDTNWIRPAGNLNLSKVLFASAAGAASTDTAAFDTFSSDKAMTLRMDGSSKNIGRVAYDITTGEIKAVKGSTAGNVALVVQGNDGTNSWYYSKKITGTQTINVSTIMSALGLSGNIDLSSCRIWLETTGSDGMIYAVAANGCSTEAELRNAINAGVTSISLACDIVLSSTLDLSDKNITLDLNGHTLKGNITLADTSAAPKSILTLIDSNPAKGGVVNGRITLTRGSNGTASHLYANGGTIKGQVSMPSYVGGIYCTSSTPTVFKDYVGNYGGIYGGIFYANINEGCIKEKTVTFMNGSSRYALEVVTSGNKAVAPAEPVKDGYMFVGWYNGDAKFNFSQSITENITLTAKWVSENVSTKDELNEAVALGSTFIRLTDNITLSDILNLSDKVLTLDLNGYTLKGNIKLADTSAAPKSILTLIDSNPAKGGVVNGRITLTRGSNGTASHLYANGGTIKGQVSMPSYVGGIYCTSSTPTVFKDYVGNYGGIYGGIFYANINEGCIKEKTVTFMNGSSRYAIEVVASGSKVAEPASPAVKAGYQSFDGWYEGDTKYIFGSSLSENITLTAKFGNPITYNITYDLGEGGTADNPETYTVESEAITLTNPTKYGHIFTGWSGTGLTGENNMTVTIPKGSTGDRVYTAHYTAKSVYSVVFDTNGGDYIPPKTNSSSDYYVLDNVDTPKKSGYTFAGWKCGNTTVSETTKYSDLAGDAPVPEIKLTAQWEAKNYTISFNTDGGNSINSRTDVKWTDIVLRDITDPTREGYTFIGWKCGETDVDKNASYADLAGSDAVKSIELTAQWKENTAPTGTISIGKENWGSFSDNIDFRLFYKDNQTVTITSTSSAVTIEYLLSDSVLTLDELAGASFAQYTGELLLDLNQEYVIYAKLTDANGNVTYINSDGIVLDNVAPVISDIERGNTYCPEHTVTVTEKYIARVTVNSTDVLLDENNQFALSLPASKKEIVVTDKAGNVSEAMIVTVSDGHQDENKDHKCDFCSTNVSVHEDNDKDHVCDICGETLSEENGGGGDYIPFAQKPTIEAGEGVKVTLSTDGTVVTITVDDGYELADVVLNGVSKGKVTEVKGLKTGDKLAVTAEKKPAEPTEPTKEEILAVLADQKLVARSKLVTMKNGKKAVLITWYNRNGEMMDFDGVEIFRSTKRNSGYGKKPIFTSVTGRYYNTAVKKGTKYYYKVRGFVIIDGQKYYTDWSLKAIRTVK